MDSVRGYHRLIDQPTGSAVMPEDVLAPHRQRTLQRMQGQRAVLCVQDSTDLNLAEQPGSEGPRLHMHALLVVNGEGIPLGVPYIECEAPDRASPPERHKTGCWEHGLQACAELAAELDGVQPVLVMDCPLADVSMLFAEQRRLRVVDLLVRVQRDRSQSRPSLLDGMRSELAKAHLETVREAHAAVVALRWKTLYLPVPQQGEPQSEEAVRLNLVHVQEETALGNSGPLGWFLLTTLPVKSSQDAGRILEWYRLRRRIEDWHQVLESGCKVEALGRRREDRIERAVTINAVIAWRLTAMTLMRRDMPELPPEVLYSDTEILALRDFAKDRKLPAPHKLGRAVRTMAILGGHLNRNKDPLSGRQEIWEGYTRLAVAVQTYERLLRMQHASGLYQRLIPKRVMRRPRSAAALAGSSVQPECSSKMPPASPASSIKAGTRRWPPNPSISLTLGLCLMASLVTSLLLWALGNRLLDSQVVQHSLAVRTAVATTGELVKSLRVSGPIGTLHYAAIRVPELRGPRDVGWSRLTLAKLADAGSLVEAGSVVAEFDLKRLEDHIADRQSRVTRAKANLRKKGAEILVLRGAERQGRLKAQARFEKALLDLRQAEVRSAIEAEILRNVAEEARAAWKQRQDEERLREVVHAAGLRRVALDVEKEALHVERHQHDYNSLQVRTPIGGMAVRETIFNSSGEFAQVRAGDQIYPGTFFMRIVDVSRMTVRAAVNQVDAQSVRIGNTAVVRLDAYPRLQFSAHVADLAPVASTGSGGLPFSRGNTGNFVRHISALVLIENKDKRILPDLSASADVMVSTGQRGVLIPREALRHEVGRNAGEFVYVVDGDEYRKRVVDVQDLSDTEALIRSGLEPGERFLLSRLSDTQGGPEG